MNQELFKAFEYAEKTTLRKPTGARPVTLEGFAFIQAFCNGIGNPDKCLVGIMKKTTESTMMPPLPATEEEPDPQPYKKRHFAYYVKESAVVPDTDPQEYSNTVGEVTGTFEGVSENQVCANFVEPTPYEGEMEFDGFEIDLAPAE